MDKIRPGVVIDGITHYPANSVWLLSFALGGCQWAVDAINEEGEEHFKNRLKIDLYVDTFDQGEGI